MTTATPEYLRQVFDYEEQGYTAAESGDQAACDKTISDWSLGAEDRQMIYASIESGAER
jgi:hypothetical protein